MATDYVTEAELAAYPGVAAPAATLALVRDIVNGLTTDILGEATDPVPWKIKAAALALAASRVSGNADGASQVTVQIDDYKETRMWPDGAAARGDIGYTAAQVRALLVAAGLARPRTTRSIRLNVPVSVVDR